ncbi:hypothetical protein RGQ29_019410 [Quercus rubra]|uniref:mitogen-activated protein kinase kinase kinase n=1 Tax=Quercus rubra TaxID=3512 RepID=A0AAN7F8Y4_QUERU|nr:hypothetical protein RGQ29_019410 [Quercus rubra]
MDWTRGQIIGRGSSATVSVAKVHGSGEIFAAKSTELSQSEFLKREQRILSTISCPQIVAYKGCNVSSENGKLLYNLFMEYAPRGTLIDAIHSQGGGLGEATIQAYTRKIVLGLEFLHSNSIVHCDIKCHNILVTNDGVKIADLGCARELDDVSSADLAIAGTPVFMAPEVARGEQQGFPADVWALGCTMIEMATGRAPWPGVSDPVSALYRIGYSGEVPEVPNFMSKQAKDFLGMCLKRDPMERWSASELLNHSFLEEPKFQLKEVNSFDSDTPTCVLDKGFWESMEEPETNPSTTYKSSLNSVKERIQRLSEGSTTLCQQKPNWACEEDWVTVRSNSNKEPELVNSSQDFALLNANESIASVSRDNNLVFYNGPTSSSGIEACNISSSIGGNDNSNSSNNRGSLVASECTKESSKCTKVDLNGNNISFENNAHFLLS